MNYYLKYLFTLIICLFIIDRSVSLLIDKVLESSNFRFINIEKENPDFYVLGNSRGVNSVKESQFDSSYCLDVLNISFVGLNPGEIKYLIKKINNKKPVLIEISSLFSHNNSSTSPSQRFSVFKNLREKRLDVFNLYRFNNDLFLRSIYYLFSSDKSWGNNRVLDSVKKKILLKKENTLEINTSSLMSFQSYLDQNNINYMFYYAPIHPEKKNLISNWKSINSHLKNTLNNRYLDLSDLIKNDLSFADLIHTNGRQQDLIHNSIFEFLKSNNILCSD